MIKKSSSGRTIYGYDRLGQLESICEENGTEIVRYCHTPGEKLKKIRHGNRSQGDASCQYDQQGNILEEISSKGKTEYRYNAFNQQIAVLTKDGQAQENQYDAEYLRAGIIENGRVSSFLYYNGELLTESDQDETVTSLYLLGYGVAAGWQNGKEGYHSYHLDEQNSTAYIIDSGQRIENSYQYNAFGGIRSNNEKIHNRILYTGQQYDQVTGQYYLRARYYNPVLGRFMQEDPYRGDGLSLYNYCRNNPLKYYDPSGFAKKFSLADYKIPYSGKSRPNFDSGLVQGVWDNAPRNISGNVYNVRNPEIELFWDKNKNRYDQWHMGHLEGHEYSDLHADYISDMNQLIADLEPYENVLSDKTKKKILKSRIDEFKGEYNNAGNYAPEDPDINMSHKNEAKKEKNDKCKG